jgi:hypothetical protein
MRHKLPGGLHNTRLDLTKHFLVCKITFVTVANSKS